MGRWGVVTTFLRTWEPPKDRQKGRLGELVRLLTGTHPPTSSPPTSTPSRPQVSPWSWADHAEGTWPLERV